MCTGSAPKPPPPPPPAPPPPPPPEPPPKVARLPDRDRRAAERRMVDRRRAARGPGATVLTGGQGLTQPVATGVKRLLGR